MISERRPQKPILESLNYFINNNVQHLKQPPPLPKKKKAKKEHQERIIRKTFSNFKFSERQLHRLIEERFYFWTH